MDRSDKNTQTSKFSFCDDGGRATVDEYKTNLKFRVGDEVYICIPGKTTREGPYIINSVEKERYTLCNANLEAVHGNNAFEEKDLELYNPFE